jgi:MFS family permease
MHTSRKMTFGRYDYAVFLTFFAYAAGSVVIPVALVELALDLGFSLEEGGMAAGGALNIGRTLTIVAAMLLVGFAAGHWGARRTLGASVIFMGAGMMLCAFAPVYGILFLALMLAGLGEGVIEGLATPFVQKLHPEEPGRYTNFSHAFWSIGVLVTVILSGGLLTLGVSWRTLVGVVSLTGVLAGVLMLMRPRSGQQIYPDAMERTHWRQIKRQAIAVIRVPRFWLYYFAMFMAGGGEFCLTFWSASHIQLHYGASPWSGGLGVAFFAAGMTLARTGWGYLIHQDGLKKLILYSAAAGTLVCLLIPTADSIWVFFALIFFAGIATGPFWPSIQSHATDQLPDTDQTMLLILLSCAGVPGCGVFTYLMGYLGNQSGSLTTAFYLVPASYALLGILIGVDHVYRNHRAQGQDYPAGSDIPWES